MEIDLVQTVLKVHLTLDFLKTVGLHDGAGQGPQVNISVMPDFVFDFHKHLLDLQRRDLGSEVWITDVGGRGARVARDLGHLQAQADGTLNVHLFAVTGHIGRALLEKRLKDTLTESGCRALSLRHIQLAKQSRWALVDKKVNPSRLDFLSLPASKRNELSVENLKKDPYAADRVLAESTIIAMMSIKSPHWSELLQHIAKLNDTILADAMTIDADHQRRLIIDTAQANRDIVIEAEDRKSETLVAETDERVKQLLALFKNDSKIALTTKALIVDELELLNVLEECTGTPAGLSGIIELAREHLHCPVLYLSKEKQSALFANELGDAFCIPFPKGLDMHEADSRESVKAGFILASAVQRLQLIYREQYNQVIGSHVGEPLTAQDCVAYGLLLGTVWTACQNSGQPVNKPHDHPERSELISFVLSHGIEANIISGISASFAAVTLAPQQPCPVTYDEILSRLDSSDTNLIDRLAWIEVLPLPLDGPPPPDKLIQQLIRDTQLDNWKNVLQAARLPREDQHTYQAMKHALYHFPSIECLGLSAKDLLLPLASARALREISAKTRQLSEMNDDLVSKQWVKVHQSATGQSEPHRAVFIDIDSTLLDSAEIRYACWGDALDRLFVSLGESHPGIPPSLNPKTKVQWFELLIYRTWEFCHALRFEDFRQRWNAEDSYALFLFLTKRFAGELSSIAEGPDCDCAVRKWFLDKFFIEDVHKQINFSEESLKGTGLKGPFKLSNAGETLCQDVIREKAEVLDDIASARQAFDAREIEAFHDARDFIETLTYVTGCSVYGVTEGDPATQWKKLQRIGLAAKALPASHLLTTGAACQPVELNKLRDELASTEVELAKLSFAQTTLKTSIQAMRQLVDEDEQAQNSRQDLDTLLEPVMAERDGLRRLKADVEKRKQHCEGILKAFESKFGQKVSPQFFSLVCTAVGHKQDAPAGMFASFSNALDANAVQGKNPGFRFVMVGDRWKNDTEPLKKLFKHSADRPFCIRFASASYLFDQLPNESDLWPDLCVETLTQAKVILLQESLWRSLLPVKQTDVLLEYVDQDPNLVELLLWSMSPRNETIPPVSHRYARMIISENTRHGGTPFESLLMKMREKVVFPLKDDASDSEDQAVAAIRVLAEMTLALHKGVFPMSSDNIKRISELGFELVRVACFLADRLDHGAMVNDDVRLNTLLLSRVVQACKRYDEFVSTSVSSPNDEHVRDDYPLLPIFPELSSHLSRLTNLPDIPGL